MQPEDIKTCEKSQVLELRLKQVRLGVKGIRIAKELNRTPAAISQAYAGSNNRLLVRIERYLNRVERNRMQRQSPSQSI